jgi:hypothetical protein
VVSGDFNSHIDPGFTGLVTSENVKYNIRVAARASVPTIFRFYEGNSLQKSIQVQMELIFLIIPEHTPRSLIQQVH